MMRPMVNQPAYRLAKEYLQTAENQTFFKGKFELSPRLRPIVVPAGKKIKKQKKTDASKEVKKKTPGVKSRNGLLNGTRAVKTDPRKSASQHFIDRMSKPVLKLQKQLPAGQFRTIDTGNETNRSSRFSQPKKLMKSSSTVSQKKTFGVCRSSTGSSRQTQKQKAASVHSSHGSLPRSSKKRLLSVSDSTGRSRANPTSEAVSKERSTSFLSARDINLVAHSNVRPKAKEKPPLSIKTQIKMNQDIIDTLRTQSGPDSSLTTTQQLSPRDPNASGVTELPDRNTIYLPADESRSKLRSQSSLSSLSRGIPRPLQEQTGFLQREMNKLNMMPVKKMSKSGKLKKKKKKINNKENIDIQIIHDEKENEKMKDAYNSETGKHRKNDSLINHIVKTNQNQTYDEVEHQEIIQVRNMEFQSLQPPVETIQSLQEQLNKMSAISTDEKKIDRAQKFEEKLAQNVDQVTIEQITEHFIEPTSLAGGTLKAAKALCYVIAVIHPDRQDQKLQFTKLPEIKHFLLKNHAFLYNFSQNIMEQTIKICHEPSLLTPVKLHYLGILNKQIFGKLIQENASKKDESRVFNSPRVRNSECKNFFAVAYFCTMLINEFINDHEQAEQSRQQYRSEIVDKNPDKLQTGDIKIESSLNSSTGTIREIDKASQNSKTTNSMKDQSEFSTVQMVQHSTEQPFTPEAKKESYDTKPSHHNADSIYQNIPIDDDFEKRALQTEPAITSKVESAIESAEKSLRRSAEHNLSKQQKAITEPNCTSESSRNVSQIVKTTEDFIQILDSCTKDEQKPVSFYHQRRGGIRVEDLINRFKSEANFDTMCKNLTTPPPQTRNMNTSSFGISASHKTSTQQKDVEIASRSNDLYSVTNGGNDEDIQIVKLPTGDPRLHTQNSGIESSRSLTQSQQPQAYGQGQGGSTSTAHGRNKKSMDTNESQRIIIQSNLDGFHDGIDADLMYQNIESDASRLQSARSSRGLIDQGVKLMNYSGQGAAKNQQVHNAKEALSQMDTCDARDATDAQCQKQKEGKEEINAYGDCNLLEQTSRALDIAAGNQEQSPMVVVMASNRSNNSAAASRQILSQRDHAPQALGSGRQRQRSSRSQRRANRKSENEAAEAYDQQSSGEFSYKTPRVLNLPSTDREYGQGESGGNNAVLNDQSPIQIMGSQNSNNASLKKPNLPKVELTEDQKYAQIIANLENLKRERARSEDRRSGHELKKHTDEIVECVRSQMEEEINQISQIQGGENENNENQMRTFDIDADHEAKSEDIALLQQQNGRRSRQSSAEKYSKVGSIVKSKELDQQILQRSKSLLQNMRK